MINCGKEAITLCLSERRHRESENVKNLYEIGAPKICLFLQKGYVARSVMGHNLTIPQTNIPFQEFPDR